MSDSTVTVYYEWRQLTREGLLITPEAIGPYYDEFEINYESMHTEEEALARLELYAKTNNQYFRDFVLVKLYREPIKFLRGGL